jgi:hypothetical protein
VNRVDIADGFPLFRESPGGTVRNALGGSRQWMLVDVEPQVLAWKFHFVMGMGLYWGVNGPSYAVDVVLAGSQEGNSLELTGSQSRAISGLELGLGVRFFMTLDIQQWSVESHWVSDGWHSHLEFDTAWKDAGRLNLDVTVDLISLLLSRIAKKNFTHKANRYPSGLGLAAVESTSTNGFGSTGTTQLAPTFSAIWDLTETIAGLKTFKENIAKRYHGILQLGPTINLSLPARIDIVKAATGGSLYDLHPDDGVLRGVRSGASPVGEDVLEVTFRHKASVAFGFGVSGSLTWLKVLSIGYSSGPLVDLLSLLGLTPVAGPYDHRLRAPIGGSTDTLVASMEPGASYEVVFEDAELATP